jgi:hypothetical protein
MNELSYEIHLPIQQCRAFLNMAFLTKRPNGKRLPNQCIDALIPLLEYKEKTKLRLVAKNPVIYESSKKAPYFLRVNAVCPACQQSAGDKKTENGSYTITMEKNPCHPTDPSLDLRGDGKCIVKHFAHVHIVTKIRRDVDEASSATDMLKPAINMLKC